MELKKDVLVIFKSNDLMYIVMLNIVPKNDENWNEKKKHTQRIMTQCNILDIRTRKAANDIYCQIVKKKRTSSLAARERTEFENWMLMAGKARM